MTVYDLDGRRIWLRILKAVGELVNAQPSYAAAAH